MSCAQRNKGEYKDKQIIDLRVTLCRQLVNNTSLKVLLTT